MALRGSAKVAELASSDEAWDSVGGTRPPESAVPVEHRTTAPSSAAELPHAAMVQMLDGANQGFVVHRGGPPLFANRTMKAMAGALDDPEFLQRPVSQWIHPEDAGQVGAAVRARLTGTPAPEDYQFRILRSDHAVVWVDCRATVIEWSDGPAVLAALFDITAQKEAQRDHQRTEALFERVFQATPDMVSISHLSSGVIVDVNQNTLDAIGCSRDEIVGRSGFDAGFWADPEMPARIRAAILENGSLRNMEASLRSRDGTVFPVSFSAETIMVDGEALLLIIGRDITEERLREGELMTSRDAAELANRTKSEFLANMSHELRTPLNAILGFSEIIRNGTLGPVGDPRYSEYAEDIHRSGAHLLEIINDILDLSKVEAGRLEVFRETVRFGEIAEHCMRLVRERAYDAELKLSLEMVPEDFSLSADRRLLKQLLLNLVSNAIKFTPAGGAVTVRAENGEDGCRLTVTDTGIGMAPDEIERALTPFGQIDSALTRRHQGTGLGLPLVAAFVEAHDGTLEIDSTKGRGTAVTVFLPASPH